MQDKLFARKLSNDSEKAYDLFVDMLISQLGTLFASPEEDLVRQGDKSNSMCLIVSGNCFKKENGIPINSGSNKLFSRGDHFGEIGCLYSCNRTCTIKSIDYIILAKLSRD